MLKVSRRDQPGKPAVLKIEGTLGGAWVHEVRTECEALLAEQGRAVLDLAGVVYVDRAGADLLASLQSDSRISIQSASAFVTEILKGGAA